MRTTLFPVMILMFTIGCGESSNSTTTQSTATEEEITYTGPPVLLSVSDIDDGTQIEWSFEVPTGGWGATFARATSAGATGDWINVYVDLIEPGPNEIVTQAIETISDSYTHPIESPTVRLFVRQAKHGAEPTDDAFDLAAVHVP